MKNKGILAKRLGFLAIALVAVIGFAVLPLTGCPSPDEGTKPGNKPTNTPTVINISAIGGITAPITGETPATAITATAQYTGTVTWSPNDSTFAALTAYTATITLTAKTGFTLQGVAENFFTVSGAETVSNAANSGTITAVFPEIGATPIAKAEITVTAPVKDATAHTTARDSSDEEYFTVGTVSWSPEPVGGKFEGGKVYTATVTLTANTGHTFTNSTTAEVNGQTAVKSDNPGKTVTLSYTFPATDTRTVTKIEIKAQPTGLSYTHGEALDLAGLVVTLTYDEGDPEDIAAANFTAKNITADPAQGAHLVHLTHDGQPVTITYGDLNPLETDDLTVNPKATTLTVQVSGVSNLIYNGSPRTGTVSVADGTTYLNYSTEYTFEYSDNTNAGQATVTATGKGNYAGSTGSAHFTINKATPSISQWPTATEIYQGGLLSASVLSGGQSNPAGSFAWTDGTISPASGTNSYGVTFTPTDTANYNTATGSVSVTVLTAPYIITGSGTAFTATKGSATIGTANQAITNVITAIRTAAAGNPASIRFGDGTTALNIGTANVSFNNTDGTWGAITLSGKITGANTSTTEGTIAIADNISVTSTADIANTYNNENARAVYFNSTGTLTLSGGTVSATAASGTAHGQAVNIANTGLVTVNGTAMITSANIVTSAGTIVLSNAGARLLITGGTVTNTATSTNARTIFNSSSTSTDAVSISGGTVQTTSGCAVYNNNTGTVTIKDGGTVQATGNSGYAVYNRSTGPVTISGGTVSATTGYAVYTESTNSSGGISVSGNAKVTSANPDPAQGTIFCTGTVTNSVMIIDGGTIENTATTGNAVFNTSSGQIILRGNPTITGTIYRTATGGSLFTASGVFTPGSDKIYRLGFSDDIPDGIAVSGGASFITNFTSVNSSFTLSVSGSNIQLSYNQTGPGYKWTKAGNAYTVTKVTTEGDFSAIQPVINAIRTDASAAACSIQFGDGTNTLDIGSASASFNTTGGNWGAVTLSGKITSNVTGTGTITTANTVSITSTADITNTANSTSSYAIYHNSTGVLTISS
ncbi:beta strand repeat-containing protein, partial [Treponema sp. R80B11-R83G3]